MAAGAVSNAGFECVAIADNLGRFTLPRFGAATARTLEAIIVRSRIDKVVDIHNPLDLTPMTGDEAYADTVRALLGDEQYDAAVVGIVPLTAALNTLPPGAGHGEDVARGDGIVSRLAALKRDATKPWWWSSMPAPSTTRWRGRSNRRDPTFRTATRLRLLNVYCASAARRRPVLIDDAVHPREWRLIRRLDTPARVQAYLNSLPYNEEPKPVARRCGASGSVRRGTAHCSRRPSRPPSFSSSTAIPARVELRVNRQARARALRVQALRKWGSIARSRDRACTAASRSSERLAISRRATSSPTST